MVKKLSILFFITVLMVSISSCGTSKKATMAYSDLNGEWGVIEMNGKILNPAETKQSLVFDTATNTVSGNAGCNRVSGRIEYSVGQPRVIRFMQMVSTRMACPDMTLEDEYLKTIDKVTRFEPVTQDGAVRTVALYGFDNTRLFVIQKK